LFFYTLYKILPMKVVVLDMLIGFKKIHLPNQPRAVFLVTSDYSCQFRH
jgi:hypothetical protein